MKKNCSMVVKLMHLLIFSARILVAVTVMWVGYTFTTGELYLAQTMGDRFGTGLFLLIIGAYFFFSAFLRQFFDP